VVPAAPKELVHEASMTVAIRSPFDRSLLGSCPFSRSSPIHSFALLPAPHLPVWGGTALCYLIGMSRILRGVGLATTAAFLVSAYTPLWNLVGARLAVPSAAAPADAIVVLGAGLANDDQLQDQSLRRTVEGIRLFKENLASILILSGPPRSKQAATSEAKVRRDLAVQLGVPALQISLIENVATTRDEASEVAKFLKDKNASSVVLVTDALHMKRAMKTFENLRITVLPAPSGDLSASARSATERLELMESVLRQGTALMLYRLAGYF
jgi:uncharacterized SAM-binding protein YcdF (DUF218 family)